MVNVVRSPELEEFARLGRRKFEEGDAAWFDRTTAHGDIASFGTAPGEESRGREDVLRLTIDEISEMDAAAGVDIARDQPADEFAVEAYQAGDAGWIVTHDSFRLPDGTTFSNRVITVAVRDDEGWKTVLTASQLLVPNELLVPGSPLGSGGD